MERFKRELAQEASGEAEEDDELLEESGVMMS